MKKFINYLDLILILILVLFVGENVFSQKINNISLANKNFEVEVYTGGDHIDIKVTDLKQKVVWADGIYTYQLSELVGKQLKAYSGLKFPKVLLQTDRIRISGLLNDFEIMHDIILGAGNSFLTEEMKIVNTRSTGRCVKGFSTSFCKRVTGMDGEISEDYVRDRFMAVPFLHRADDTVTYNQHDYSLQQIVDGKGFKYFTTELFWRSNTRAASHNFISEGWGWKHKNATLGIFSFNQDNMIFSTVSYNKKGFLNFGGFTKEGLNLSAMERFDPGSSIYLGMNRFYPISGGYNQVAYKYRDMLDELGCRFPKDYNPPVHWEQLYSKNMADAWRDDRKLFTLDNLLTNEVKKAKEYSCQALYLDPGWDTKFGSFIWATDRLGDMKNYVETMEKEHGLKTSLHTPLAPWATNENLLMGPSSVATWSALSRRLVTVTDSFTQKKKLIESEAGPKICFGSVQHRDEAEKRLLDLCEADVTFLMFDGSHWNGPCEDPRHEHPIPYLYEDQIDACIDLVRRIHQKFPDVLIEMHDMLIGGGYSKPVPVYYKYGLPGSYDENWAFELMWSPFKHIENNSALALYYYNLGSNVPLYLHIDIGQDNANSLVLWWYASTCRHLGIGVNNDDPILAANHKRDMKLYIELQDFFKRGDFYGINEEIHVHTLPERNECVVNIFNLSKNPKTTQGSISLSEIGLNPELKYTSDKDWIKISQGKVFVKKGMKSLDADLATIKPL